MRSSSRSRTPYRALPFAKVDLGRWSRRGFPEVIYARGKTAAQVVAIARTLRANGHPLLITKVPPAMARAVLRQVAGLRYHPAAQILAASRPAPGKRRAGRNGNGRALVITAGTSDIPVAEEAVVTLRVMGVPVERLFDVGVAGVHRLLRHTRRIRKARVIVVVAGMDGALPSVVSGLTAAPVVAVPTSVGYGASFRGVAPLLTMLNSCSPGVGVVNIDNGFGAGYLAAIIARTR